MAVDLSAQRMGGELGRGVVAVQNGNSVLVSWRRLAQEPENASYNVYVKKPSAAGYAKVNASPLKHSNFSSSTSAIPLGSHVAVSILTNDRQNQTVESELSVPFHFKSQFMRNVFVDIRFNGSPLPNADYATKYVWPYDLDGDGEVDYVVDRNPVSGGTNKLEGYLRDGTYLWTIDMGPNESIGLGQDDQVAVYDFDLDGLGEVMIQTSDGTRFWDKAKGSWGRYVNHKDSPDVDGDGITNYALQNTKNPPRYFTVVDGMTGEEQTSVEMHYNNAYNRTNKAALMGDEYNKHVGKFCIAYLDGIHPSLVMEWHTRNTNGSHNYYDEGFGYDFSSGTAGELRELFLQPCGNGSFHSIRVGDPDLDGKDEMIEGGWTMDHTGRVLFNAGIAHGDRFRTSDIDPERPGLETFAIQQEAGDMLGQILYDASNGKAIKKWYLSGVGDVGRGDCYDMDASHLGWEMFSTMNGNAIYDAQGNDTGKKGYFPTEALWWDGDLGREYLAAPDGNGYNAYIAKYDSGRLIEMAKLSGWQVNSEYGARAAFWGDIIGDWREEVILKHLTNGVTDGFTGFSTDYTTTEDRIYCLLQDPHYRGDCHTKGYYQTPNPGFYLGYGMPRPPLPPVMVADLTCSGGSTYSDFGRVKPATYQDGNSVLYDLGTGEDVDISALIKPGTVYMMPVLNQVIRFSGAGEISGENDIWKSQNGTALLNVPVTTSGTTYISEGILESYSRIDGPIELRAKGTLAGAPVVNGNVKFEGALNYEGCRLMPNGVMTFTQSLTIDKRVFIELTRETDCILVKGDLNIVGKPVFTITFPELHAGRYKLMEYTGTFTGSTDNLDVRGITGLSYNMTSEDNAIWLVINEQRQPNDNVVWTGSASNVWDYQTTNFAIEGKGTEFVAEDKVLFDDSSEKTSVTIDDLMPTTGIVFENDTRTYTFTGGGGFSGKGGLTMNGNGKVVLGNVKSDYTGATVINSGTVTIKDLADGGMASSIGAASASASNWKVGKAKIIIDNASTSTSRGLTLTDTATINVPSGTCALKGLIAGTGTFVKTGNGQVNFTYGGANSYSGGTILNGGTIAMGTWNTTFGTATSRIYVASNSTITIFNNNTTSAVPSFRNRLEIRKGVIVNVNAGKRCVVSPTLEGEGTMKINFPYVRGDFGPDASGFEGTIQVTSGEVRLATALNMQKGTLRLDADNYVYNNGGTHKVGALIGGNAGASLASGTWYIGYLGTSTTFAGAVNVPMTKVGDGVLTLTGSSKGSFTVNGGTLDVENTASSTTTGPITVNDGGTLTGTGQTGPVSIARGGVLKAGKSSALTGSLTLNGTLKVSSGGIIVVRGRGTTSLKTDSYNVSGKVSLVSPVFRFSRISGEWQDGDELKIFTGEGTISLTGTPTFEPEVPMEGYMWDYSELAASGVVKVVADPTAVNGVGADDKGATEVYDLMGRKVNVPSRGIYIINGKKVYRL